jgi:hypothetical protein
MPYKSTDPEIITTHLLRFRNFLNDVWPPLNILLDDHDWDNDPYIVEDWLDDNWSHLFVRQILGKDFNFQPLTASIIDIKKHRYQYWLHVDNPPQAIFLTLGTKNDGFSISPPFDRIQVLTIKDEIDIVPLYGVKFSLTGYPL